MDWFHGSGYGSGIVIMEWTGCMVVGSDYGNEICGIFGSVCVGCSSSVGMCMMREFWLYAPAR